MRGKLSTKFYLLALILIAVLVNWRWLFSGSYFAWGDSQLYAWFNESWQSFWSFPQIWSTLYGRGQIDIQLSHYPVFYTFGLLSRLNIDPRILVKFIYFIPSAILPVLGSFVLLRHITKTNTAAFVGSIVYSYNVSALMMHAGLQPLNIVYGLAPFILYVFIHLLHSPSMKLILLTGLVSLLASIYEFRIFYIVAYVLLFYFVFYLITKNIISRPKYFIKKCLIALAPLVIVGVLSAYWLVPFVSTGSLQENNLFSRPVFGNGFMSLKQSVAFFYPWWTAGNGYANGVVQSIPPYFWSIPLLALFGYVLNFKNPKVYFFVFLSLLGILLTKQADKPFPGLYQWLYDHFPGFNAYREASKFFVIQSLGYSSLIAFFIARFESTVFKSKMNSIFPKVAFLGLSTIICLLFLVNTKPFITGKIGALFVPKSRPQDFTTVKDFIAKQDVNFRTAWFPASGLWSYFDSKHPKINLHTLYFDSLHSILSKQAGYSQPSNLSSTIGDVNHQVLSLFTQASSDKLLDLLNIKYIIVPPEDVENDDNLFVNYGMPDRQYILDFLNQLKYLSRVDIGTEGIVVFENFDYRPLIYATSESESLSDPVSYQPVDYDYLSPTLLEIDLKNADATTYLHFADSFNRGWKLAIAEEIVLPELQYGTHGLLNSFRLKSTYLESSKASSNKLKISLYYDNQKYVYHGLVISFIGLAFILGMHTLPKWHKS